MSVRQLLREVLALVVVGVSFVVSAHADNINKAEMLEAIVHTMPITHLDAPAELSGEVTIVQRGGKVTASYVLLVNSPQQWREELAFANYHEARITDADKLYVVRSGPIPDPAIMRIFSAMHEAAYRRPSTTGKFKFREQKQGKAVVRCVEISERGKFGDRQSEICLYPDGNVARSDLGGASYLFFDYAPVGSRSVPQHVVITENREPVADIRISKIAAPNIKEEWFSKPPSGQEFDTCETPTTPELVNKVRPLYPRAARMSGTQGTVVLYAFVAPDGRITELRTLKSPAPLLEQASLEAVKQWTYVPPMCGTTAVAAETLITVNYSLQP